MIRAASSPLFLRANLMQSPRLLAWLISLMVSAMLAIAVPTTAKANAPVHNHAMPVAGPMARTDTAAPRIALTPIRLTERVYYFRGESGPASAANKGFMSNAGFIITNDGVVLFDALATPALGSAMLEAIKTVTQQPVRRVIVSHYHADHIYGLQALKAAGAEIWAHENGRLYLDSDAARLRLAQRRAELFPWVDEQTRLLPADRWLAFQKDKTIRFTMGDVGFRLIDASGAHSDEDLMLFVEGEGVLFTGDLYFTGRLPFVGNADSRRWLLTLDQLQQIRPALAVPGHGAASAKAPEELQLTRDYLLYLRQTMGAAVESLSSFDDAYAQTDWSRFEKMPAFQATNRVNAYGTYLLMERESLQKK